jgi:hypothetical protein
MKRAKHEFGKGMEEVTVFLGVIPASTGGDLTATVNTCTLHPI